MTPLDRILDLLPGHRKNGRGFEARCPGHDDRKASLSICEGDDGRVLLKCHADCDTSAIVAALGLTMADLFPPSERKRAAKRIVHVYDYIDLTGTVRHQTVRYANPKDFKQRRPDGQGGYIWKLDGVETILYRLPELQGQADVIIVEGEKDTDRLRGLGFTATCNPMGAGKWYESYTAQLKAAGCTSVVILPDLDPTGQAHAQEVAASGAAAGLAVRVIALPGLTAKGADVSDWLDAGHTADELRTLVAATPSWTGAPAALTAPPVPPRTLADVHAVFRHWLGDDYDLGALDAVLATAAAERLNGDPLWLLLISGSGNTKTETVQALAGAGAIIVSTIASEGALLSGTSQRQKAREATGGLLARVGKRGILVVKDVTSILSMNRDTRASLLAALREIHDQRWERNVGTDGGRTLTWAGRLVVIGACTTAWDRAHDVIGSMGDRFVVVRTDSTTGRQGAGRQAMRNTGAETEMRAELAAAVGGLLSTVDPAHDCQLTDAERDRLLAAADVVTLARTGVDYDYRGDVIDAHAPEMPTRFAKELVQVVRGATALGVARADAVALAIRCARDSMPPLRLAILDDIGANPHSSTRDVRCRLEKPRATVDRQLQALHILGVLACDEVEGVNMGKDVTIWRYHLAPGIDPNVLRPDPYTVPEMSPHVYLSIEKEKAQESTDGTRHQAPTLPTDISGTVADDHPDYLWRDPEEQEARL